MNLRKSQIYAFNCRGLKISGSAEIFFAEDPFPLQQSCDAAELYTESGQTRLRLFYDDGAQVACYRPAFEFICLDNRNSCIDIAVSDDHRTDSGHPNGFTLIRITLENPDCLHRLQALFAPDTVISLAQWQTMYE